MIIDTATIGTALRTLLTHLRQWATQSPEHLAITIAAGLVALVVSLYVSVRLIRWLGRSLVRLSNWVTAAAWDVLVDGIRRWRTPSSGSDAPTRARTTEGSADDSPASAASEAGSREYLRIRPTSAEYDPEALVTALRGLHATHRTTEISAPWRRSDRDVFEFLVATRGAEAGVEFYVGGTMSLDRLATALPYRQCGFDVDRVATHPAHLLNPRTSDATSDDPPADARPPAASSSSTVPKPETAADGGGAVAKMEHTTADDTESDASTADPTAALLAHLTDQDCEPVVYRLNTQARRGNDWMMRQTGLTDLLDAPGDEVSRSSGRSVSHPLLPVVGTLDDLDGPAVYHVAWRSFRTWETQADLREYRLRTRRDTLGQRIAGFVDDFLDSLEGTSGHRRGRRREYRREYNQPARRDSRRQHDRRRPTARPHTRDEHATLARADRERLEQLDEKDPTTTAVVNVRVAAIPTAEQSRRDVARTVRDLWTTLDHLDGDYYHLDAPPSLYRERVAGLLRVRGARHRQRLRRLCRRQVTTSVLGHTQFNLRKRWPDLVCNPDELAAWTAIPSTASLPDAVTEHLAHRPAHTDPQRTLTPSIQQEYVGQEVSGVRIADLLTDNRQADRTRPVTLSGRDLYRHLLVLGMTGVGKTTDQAQRAAAAVDATRGPVIVVTGPGANVGRYTMRALAAREGLDWVQEHVHWFPFPAVMPGLTVLDVADMVEHHPDIVNRWDAVEQVRDYLIEILRQVLGSESFNRAPRSIQLIQELLMAAFDPEHWYENTADSHRVSPDRCRFSHLTTELTELAAAGPPSVAPERRPRSSRPDYDASLEELIHADPETFHNIINGAHTRLNAIANYDQRLMLFDNTEPRFSFADLLDSDDIYIFDLSSLETTPQQLMTLVLVMQLYDVLQAEQSALQSRPDDYMVNLVVDEAAHLVGFDYLSTLLAQGRNHRLAMDLATQFAEQIEEQADREAFLNLLNNTGTKLLATHNLDEEIAKHLLPEGLTVEELRQQVRDLPEAHRLLLLPPQPDEERPQALTVHRGALPRWHPDADAMPFDEEAFDATLDTIRERTAAEYGLPDDVREGVRSGWDQPAVPAGVQEALGLLRDTDIDAALALMTAHVQDESHGRETNDWVAGDSVTRRFETWLEHARDAESIADDLDAATRPDPEDVLEEVADSPYLECEAATVIPDIEQDEGLVVRLTEAGEDVVADLEATGEAGTAGSDEHDEQLAQTKQALIRAGFEVTLVEQDTSSKPDGWVVHPAVEWPLVLEAERTTRSRPDKVLTNLRRAQEQGAVPLFVVAAADDDDRDVTHPAEVVAGILSSPVNTVRERDGRTETIFYNYTNKRLTFNGGATEGGETAVRPTTGAADSRRSVWVQTAADEYALRNGAGDEYTEYLSVSDFAAISRAEVPAYYTYNDQTGERTVHAGGDTYTYESKAAFQDDWVAIKQPFLPAKEFPVPDYGRDTYAILLIRDAPAVDEEIVVVYDDETGECQPLSTLGTALTEGELQPATNTRDDTVTDERDVDAADLTARKLGVKEFASLLEGTDPDELAHLESKSLDIDAVASDKGVAALKSTEVFAVYRLIQTYREQPVYSQAAHFSRQLANERSFISEQLRDPANHEVRATYWIGLAWEPSIEPVATKLCDALKEVSGDLADVDPEDALETERISAYVELLTTALSRHA